MRFLNETLAHFVRSSAGDFGRRADFVSYRSQWKTGGQGCKRMRRDSYRYNQNRRRINWQPFPNGRPGQKQISAPKTFALISTKKSRAVIGRRPGERFSAAQPPTRRLSQSRKIAHKKRTHSLKKSASIFIQHWFSFSNSFLNFFFPLCVKVCVKPWVKVTFCSKKRSKHTI